MLSIHFLLRKIPMILAILWTFSLHIHFSIALPRGFVEEEIVRVSAITGAFAPNPRKEGRHMLLLSAKEGKINVMEDPDDSDDYFEIADFSKRICTNGERGIQTIRPHPNFEENRYIYIYYTQESEGCLEDQKKGPRNRLSRFEMDKNTLKIKENTERILLETSPLAKRVHNGGSIQFGKDGKIWVSTGEGSATSTDLDWAQNPSVLHGKILRINQDGSIPSDNPFVNDPEAIICSGEENGGKTKGKICKEIWATGMRNPFRMVMDPRTKDGHVIFHVGDVGASVWEEISIGGTDYSGVNYGWNDMEGPCKRNQNDNCPERDEFLDPFYYYEHRKRKQGGCVVGLTFVPDGIWPSKYEFLFIDFVFKEIYNLVEDESRLCRRCKPPRPGYRNETFYRNSESQNMIDMFFGPYKDTQALYIVARGAGKTLRRIRYTRGNRNRSPKAKLQITGMWITFDVGQRIQFDGSGSSDPDDDQLSYEWNFGDGTVIKGDSNEEYAYQRKGEFTVILTVYDSKGLKDSALLTVKIGEPPQAIIISPEEGATFAVEDVLHLLGNGTSSEGEDEITLTWEVRQHHADHWHPFLDPNTRGNDFDLFPAPEPEDLLAATNSYLEIRLTVVDEVGLSTTVSRNVMPEIIMVDVHTEPEGLKIMLDESEVITPATITSWKNHNLLFDVEDQYPYEFESWHNGGQKRHQSRVSFDNKYFKAVFKKSEIEKINLLPNVRDCNRKNTCGQCEGHCKTDEGCNLGLICFKKGGRGLPVPGCVGIDNSRTDWCTLPSGMNNLALTTSKPSITLTRYPTFEPTDIPSTDTPSKRTTISPISYAPAIFFNDSSDNTLAPIASPNSLNYFDIIGNFFFKNTCNICGKLEMRVTNLQALVFIPTFPVMTCEDFQNAGNIGMINPEFCPKILEFIEVCACNSTRESVSATQSKTLLTSSLVMVQSSESPQPVTHAPITASPVRPPPNNPTTRIP